jgi:phage terminase large subunit-like protein
MHNTRPDERILKALDLCPEHRFLLSLEDGVRQEALGELPEAERAALRHFWRLWARRAQVAPDGDWRVWLIQAGRGFGKTRAGAEWVREMATASPRARIALLAASMGEARSIMVEGESGILSVSPDDFRPRYESSLGRLTWPNGAQALLYSAGEPESLRGPQHSHAWCDEVAKWDNGSGKALATWDNLQLGLRLGQAPRILATTTPRAVPLLKRIHAEPGLEISRGKTDDNRANLSECFVDDVRRAFGKSRLGRQEIDGELIEDVPGALWSRSLLENCREASATSPPARVVIGVDPPASAGGDACGIVVCALGEDGIARVLADCSVTKPSPERWARAVAQAADAWNADRVVAEANQGGAMVASVLRAAEISLPVKLVHASRGKVARAEPVAALYEAGRVRHAGDFALLEDELCGLISRGRYEGPGHSPDRADALVWAMSELMLGRTRTPRVWLDTN